MSEEFQVCSKCGENKPVTEYNKHKKFCKQCQREYDLARYQKNKSRVRDCRVCGKRSDEVPFKVGNTICVSCWNAQLEDMKKRWKDKLKTCRFCGITSDKVEFVNLQNACKPCDAKWHKNYEIEAITRHKVCTICGITSKDAKFPKKYNRCIECNSKITREQRAKEYNEERFCTRCGISSYKVEFVKGYQQCAPCRAEFNRSFRVQPALYKSYGEKLRFAEPSVSEGEDGELLVECYFSGCKKVFTPTNQQAIQRVRAINGYGATVATENRLYCSEECKGKCDVYHARPESLMRRDLINSGHLKALKREVPTAFRKIALIDRNFTCEKCGSKLYLHVHHIEGATAQQMLSADLTNVLVVCKECHMGIHRQPGCTRQDYQCNHTDITWEDFMSGKSWCIVGL